MADHGAAPSAIGYLYQTDWALLELLQAGRVRPDESITLELHDDVAWEKSGEPTEVLQLKHHQSRAAGLGDKSPDWWRTLQVWMDDPRMIDQAGPILAIVTTSVAAPDSAAGLLSGPNRDVKRALSQLDAAAADASSKSTRVARDKWRALSAASRLGLVARIRVLDGSVRVTDVEAAVAQELKWGLPKGQEPTYLSLVWRWWHTVSLDMLARRRRAVSVIESEQELSRIRDMFASDNLPTLVQLSDVDEDDLVGIHDAYPFVEQLRWVRVPTKNLRKSIVDYYRAVTQETTWVDRSMIGLSEIQTFADNLKDEWERCFEDMTDELDGDLDERVREQAGLALFKKLRDSTTVAVRARYNDPFYARGKRHELANIGDIGWHPDFEDRLKKLVLGS